MKAFRIVWFIVFLYGCLFGCNDDSEETESDGEARDGVQIEAGSDAGETVFDGGRVDSNTAEAGMDADTDSRTSPSRDAGYDNGDYCPPGIDEYDDAGVNVYIGYTYRDSYMSDDPISKLHILCFTKGVDCEKYTSS
jgi:hypothetical protein